MGLQNNDETSRAVLLKIPSELYLSMVRLVLHKHRRFYGHFNKECIEALENHLDKEHQRLKGTIKAL